MVLANIKHPSTRKEHLLNMKLQVVTEVQKQMSGKRSQCGCVWSESQIPGTRSVITTLFISIFKSQVMIFEWNNKEKKQHMFKVKTYLLNDA